MATVINGKEHAQQLRDNLAIEVSKLKSDHALVPGLAVVLVGEDPASQIYVRNKAKQTVEVGMKSFEHRLDTDTDEVTLLDLIASLNADDAVHGILVQLPLPPHIDEFKVINAVSHDKDVDGFHLMNVGRLNTDGGGVVPCTPLGSLMMLKSQLGDLTGLNAVIVGRSNIVGKPMAALLLKANCTVTIAHSRTKNLEELCRTADILVAAVGRPRMIQGDWIKPGATVIDVGINRIEENGATKLVGDVDYLSASEVAGAITPVPGGVGPMTIACLLHNTVQQAKRIAGIDLSDQ
ncbi:bifunctional methylenetetrahydrofolate dehydrogenase/methenyltetrahydrofolate cyclohydrolase FolD [Granulosicoccus antarcticus]|uniref:Bifunctional protein FolD n=1 Tax=Granulosicoccus antarcticus IMCC3135 TaxID=1192854 RepID=A0A2Z2NXK5_9GAMM|nr:bifunctional methylenetetrahydrofolate dehydrogenase/methenyltetrahydrofolate cyclohydrolase FolD [Granulosicoccus antarcticus]ASJ72477.1 Bifunctional protein FolD protein [Granulosicoccus antarcticus IMCC3135]